MHVINTSRDYVMGMLCGYPKGTAERRLFLMLGAFIDGSKPGNDNGRYAMAGFVAFCPSWADIAEEWKAELDRPPAIPKFKMSLSRDKHWLRQHGLSQSDMTLKIARLSKIVRPPKTLFTVVCSISDPEFKAIVKETAVKGNKLIRQALGKHTFNTAYSMLFHNVIARTLWKVHELGIVGDQVDFVFDRENELFDNANNILRGLRRGLPKEIRPLLGDAVQRDEEKVLPLQAADLLAARVKDQCNNPETYAYIDLLMSLCGNRKETNVTLHLKEKHIRQHIEGLLKPMPPDFVPPEDWDVA